MVFSNLIEQKLKNYVWPLMFSLTFAFCCFLGFNLLNLGDWSSVPMELQAAKARWMVILKHLETVGFHTTLVELGVLSLDSAPVSLSFSSMFHMKPHRGPIQRSSHWLRTLAGCPPIATLQAQPPWERDQISLQHNSALVCLTSLKPTRRLLWNLGNWTVFWPDLQHLWEGLWDWAVWCTWSEFWELSGHAGISALTDRLHVLTLSLPVFTRHPANHVNQLLSIR